MLRQCFDSVTLKRGLLIIVVIRGLGVYFFLILHSGFYGLNRIINYEKSEGIVLFLYYRVVYGSANISPD